MAKLMRTEQAAYAVTVWKHQARSGAVNLMIHAAHRRAQSAVGWGQPCKACGNCTQALRCVNTVGFERLGLHRIYALHYARNPASGEVLQKVGIRNEGLLLRVLM